MTNQTNIFDYAESVRLRDKGMMNAAVADSDWLSRARSVAEHLAAKQGETCIEEIYRIVGLPDHANAAGSVFRGKQWECIGIKQATRVSRHAGIVRRWSLRNAI